MPGGGPPPVGTTRVGWWVTAWVGATVGLSGGAGHGRAHGGGRRRAGTGLGGDGQALAEPAQVDAQVVGRRVPGRGRLGQQLHHDGLVGRRHVRCERAQRRWRVVHLLVGDGHRVVALERRRPATISYITMPRL